MAVASHVPVETKRLSGNKHRDLMPRQTGLQLEACIASLCDEQWIRGLVADPADWLRRHRWRSWHHQKFEWLTRRCVVAPLCLNT